MSPKITYVQGDITKQDTDAVVNAANEAMLGGGGVDGAIHRAAGPGLLEECKNLRATTHPDGLKPGEAAITGGHDLAAKYIIHAVGPRYVDGEHEAHPNPAQALHDAHVNALKRADEVGAKSVSFPAISTGIFGYPLDEASQIATDAVRNADTNVKEVRFVAFDDKTHAAFSKHGSTEEFTCPVCGQPPNYSGPSQTPCAACGHPNAAHCDDCGACAADDLGKRDPIDPRGPDPDASPDGFCLCEGGVLPPKEGADIHDPRYQDHENPSREAVCASCPHSLFQHGFSGNSRKCVIYGCQCQNFRKQAEFSPGDTSSPLAERVTPNFNPPTPRGKDPWLDVGDVGLPENNSELAKKLRKKLIPGEQMAGPTRPNYPGNGLMSEAGVLGDAPGRCDYCHKDRDQTRSCLGCWQRICPDCVTQHNTCPLCGDDNAFLSLRDPTDPRGLEFEAGTPKTLYRPRCPNCGVTGQTHGTTGTDTRHFIKYPGSEGLNDPRIDHLHLFSAWGHREDCPNIESPELKGRYGHWLSAYTPSCFQCDDIGPGHPVYEQHIKRYYDGVDPWAKQSAGWANVSAVKVRQEPAQNDMMGHLLHWHGIRPYQDPGFIDPPTQWTHLRSNRVYGGDGPEQMHQIAHMFSDPKDVLAPEFQHDHSPDPRYPNMQGPPVKTGAAEPEVCGHPVPGKWDNDPRGDLNGHYTTWCAKPATHWYRWPTESQWEPICDEHFEKGMYRGPTPTNPWISTDENPHLVTSAASRDETAFNPLYTPCPKCKGRGKGDNDPRFDKSPCRNCGGYGGFCSGCGTPCVPLEDPHEDCLRAAGVSPRDYHVFIEYHGKPRTLSIQAFNPDHARQIVNHQYGGEDWYLNGVREKKAAAEWKPYVDPYPESGGCCFQFPTMEGDPRHGLNEKCGKPVAGLLMQKGTGVAMPVCARHVGWFKEHGFDNVINDKTAQSWDQASDHDIPSSNDGADSIDPRTHQADDTRLLIRPKLKQKQVERYLQDGTYPGNKTSPNHTQGDQYNTMQMEQVVGGWRKPAAGTMHDSKCLRCHKPIHYDKNNEAWYTHRPGDPRFDKEELANNSDYFMCPDEKGDWDYHEPDLLGDLADYHMREAHGDEAFWDDPRFSGDVEGSILNLEHHVDVVHKQRPGEQIWDAHFSAPYGFTPPSPRSPNDLVAFHQKMHRIHQGGWEPTNTDATCKRCGFPIHYNGDAEGWYSGSWGDPRFSDDDESTPFMCVDDNDEWGNHQPSSRTGARAPIDKRRFFQNPDEICPNCLHELDRHRPLNEDDDIRICTEGESYRGEEGDIGWERCPCNSVGGPGDPRYAHEGGPPVAHPKSLEKLEGEFRKHMDDEHPDWPEAIGQDEEDTDEMPVEDLLHAHITMHSWASPRPHKDDPRNDQVHYTDYIPHKHTPDPRTGQLPFDELSDRLNHGEHTYMVHMNPHDTKGVMTHEPELGDAIDEALDYHESAGNKGMFIDRDELDKMDPAERREQEEYGEIEYGGNTGLAYNGSEVHARPVTDEEKKRYAGLKPGYEWVGEFNAETPKYRHPNDPRGADLGECDHCGREIYLWYNKFARESEWYHTDTHNLYCRSKDVGGDNRNFPATPKMSRAPKHAGADTERLMAHLGDEHGVEEDGLLWAIVSDPTKNIIHIDDELAAQHLITHSLAYKQDHQHPNENDPRYKPGYVTKTAGLMRDHHDPRGPRVGTCEHCGRSIVETAKGSPEWCHEDSSLAPCEQGRGSPWATPKLSMDLSWGGYDPVRSVSPSSDSAPAPSAQGSGGDPWVDLGDNGTAPPRPGYIRDKKLKKWVKDTETWPEGGPLFGDAGSDANKIGHAADACTNCGKPVHKDVDDDWVHEGGRYACDPASWDAGGESEMAWGKGPDLPPLSSMGVNDRTDHLIEHIGGEDAATGLGPIDWDLAYKLHHRIHDELVGHTHSPDPRYATVRACVDCGETQDLHLSADGQYHCNNSDDCYARTQGQDAPESGSPVEEDEPADLPSHLMDEHDVLPEDMHQWEDDDPEALSKAHESLHGDVFGGSQNHYHVKAAGYADDSLGEFIWEPEFTAKPFEAMDKDERREHARQHHTWGLVIGDDRNIVEHEKDHKATPTSFKHDHTPDPRYARNSWDEDEGEQLPFGRMTRLRQLDHMRYSHMAAQDYVEQHRYDQDAAPLAKDHDSSHSYLPWGHSHTPDPRYAAKPGDPVYPPFDSMTDEEQRDHGIGVHDWHPSNVFGKDVIRDMGTYTDSDWEAHNGEHNADPYTMVMHHTHKPDPRYAAKKKTWTFSSESNDGFIQEKEDWSKVPCEYCEGAKCDECQQTGTLQGQMDNYFPLHKTYPNGVREYRPAEMPDSMWDLEVEADHPKEAHEKFQVSDEYVHYMNHSSAGSRKPGDPRGQLPIKPEQPKQGASVLPQSVGDHDADNGIDDPMKRGDKGKTKKIYPGTQKADPTGGEGNISVDNLNKTGGWEPLGSCPRCKASGFVDVGLDPRYHNQDYEFRPMTGERMMWCPRCGGIGVDKHEKVPDPDAPDFCLRCDSNFGPVHKVPNVAGRSWDDPRGMEPWEGSSLSAKMKHFREFHPDFFAADVADEAMADSVHSEDHEEPSPRVHHVHADLSPKTATAYMRSGVGEMWHAVDDDFTHSYCGAKLPEAGTGDEIQFDRPNSDVLCPECHRRHDQEEIQHLRDFRENAEHKTASDDDEDDGYYYSRCPACGDPSDYCRGGGPDSEHERILALHDSGFHDECADEGCDEKINLYREPNDPRGPGYKGGKCNRCKGYGRLPYEEGDPRAGNWSEDYLTGEGTDFVRDCPKCKGTGFKRHAAGEDTDLLMHLIRNHGFPPPPDEDSIPPMLELQQEHEELHMAGENDHNPEVLRVAAKDACPDCGWSPGAMSGRNDPRTDGPADEHYFVEITKRHNGRTRDLNDPRGPGAPTLEEVQRLHGPRSWQEAPLDSGFFGIPMAQPHVDDLKTQGWVDYDHGPHHIHAEMP